jgi:hypothetical protein
MPIRWLKAICAFLIRRAGFIGRVFAVVAFNDQACCAVDHVEVANRVVVGLQHVLPVATCPGAAISDMAGNTAWPASVAGKAVCACSGSTTSVLARAMALVSVKKLDKDMWAFPCG